MGDLGDTGQHLTLRCDARLTPKLTSRASVSAVGASGCDSASTIADPIAVKFRIHR